ncbi:PREDICTED: uncharacterized protein LOC105363327 [Ceratosolen solmsi marchali]|uniref:Uncharacterized protein LOC105363327 n=1 Tax=Ceratosolen solmsi marchali TaxID=326594 RepID=A0AAJ6YJP9_9HYME|nr:PREDICTED: uncharacterized protein LOC105363327 [Ceratosolen solmsi marchali]
MLSFLFMTRLGNAPHVTSRANSYDYLQSYFGKKSELNDSIIDMRLLFLLIGTIVVIVSDRLVAEELCFVNKMMINSSRIPSTILKRKKRSMTFPKGSAFVLTTTLLKSIQIRQPTNWNLDLEFDMIWPIPEGVDVRKPLTMRRSIWPHRRQRRELYANFESALDSQGLPGSQCILRTICESKFILNPPGISLIEDILRVIFSYPRSTTTIHDDYDKAHLTKLDCDIMYPCPCSLLDLLLNYHNDVEKYK